MELVDAGNPDHKIWMRSCNNVGKASDVGEPTDREDWLHAMWMVM